MIYIGIDPGKRGGFAIIEQGESGQQTVVVYPWDDSEFVHKMRTMAEDEDIREAGIVAAVEKVGAMHGQGVSSTFAFGVSYGYIRGVLSAFDIPYQLVLPRKWKAEFGLNSDKQKSIEVCKQLFPNVSLLPSERCRKDSDGMAEALLISTYAKRHF